MVPTWRGARQTLSSANRSPINDRKWTVSGPTVLSGWAAIAAIEDAKPNPQDMGFLYVRTFADPDGNVFEPAWMDMSAMQDA